MENNGSGNLMDLNRQNSQTEKETKEILEFYAAGGETNRLSIGIGQLEAARTKEIIERYLPPHSAVIYDIGGGTGYYAFWLSQMGHEVHLLELTPQNVQIARAKEAELGINLADYRVADARELPKPDQSADLVLLMGPLYHLTKKNERIRALKEAWRVLKPGGILFVSAINRFANVLYGLTTYGRNNSFLEEEAFQEMFLQEIKTGQHFKPTNYPYFLTRAYFHREDELKNEIIQSGFLMETLLAVQGAGWLVPDFELIWQQPHTRKVLLDTIRQVEAEISLIGVSPHYLAVARKK